jgi:hypothetical protein
MPHPLPTGLSAYGCGLNPWRDGSIRTFGPVARYVMKSIVATRKRLGLADRGEVIVFSIRNVGGVSLFLFGTTFLWVTPMFAAADVDTAGAAWATVAFLASVTIIGFTVATWGLFKRTDWWEPLAVACAVVGLVTLVPYWMAADGSGVAKPLFDVVILAAGSFGVLLLLRFPRLERWVHGHVAIGH